MTDNGPMAHPRTPTDATTDADADGTLMSIGAFGRRVGLAPSALRFYDDCGVLRPAAVDESTGYRRYSPRQESRAVLIRRLRSAGLPLTDALVVLDGDDPAAARSVLEEHARRASRTAAAARDAVGGILRELPGAAPGAGARTTVGGAEFAGALRQVAPAIATGARGEEIPALGRILLELTGAELRVVATDRYRMAIRTLRPYSGTGEPDGTGGSDGTGGTPVRLTLDGGRAKEIAAWALRLPTVTVSPKTGLSGGDRVLPLRPDPDGEYPDYRAVLAALPPVRHRIIADRDALRTALTDRDAKGFVVLRAEGERLLLVHHPADTSGPGGGAEVPGGTDGATAAPEGTAPGGPAGQEVPAVHTGVPLAVAFDPEVLLPAVAAGVGPDVLLEISAADGPVVVRSADQGDFTTLVMPVRLPGSADDD
ncbi:MerR family transcriptional regulator [Streptomyces sp. NPDC020875]|uniref:MerR family transcriptional regulator n=1 Tax=Streptomyces sp. NPDC020875 TaxID=3154898 RepID=UPI0033EE3A8F